ncbi:MAG: transmembrane 220 family protein [Bacteroidia bacterium]|nr:transmembrane 220 family protein [Bacteroidia bacterium]
MMARIIIGILFIAFAVVQFNDPDPWLWIAAYGIVGFMYLVSAKKPISRAVILLLILAFGIVAVLYIPNVINWVNEDMPSIVGEMKATSPHIEWMREFLGLTICLLGLGWLYHVESARIGKNEV